MRELNRLAITSRMFHMKNGLRLMSTLLRTVFLSLLERTNGWIMLKNGKATAEITRLAQTYSWFQVGFLQLVSTVLATYFLSSGNLEVDLQARMWTTAIGLLVQLWSARLGVAT